MDDVFKGKRFPADDAVIRAARRRARDEAQTTRHLAAGMLLRTFRSYLQATVNSASPVLLRALERDGIGFEDALAMLRPPTGWPDPPVRIHSFRYATVDAYLLPSTVRRRKRPHPVPNDLTLHCGAKPGAILRGSGHPDGLLAVHVIDRALEVSIGLGECSLVTHGGLAHLRVPGPLPETLAVGIVGRPVEQVAEHPLLQGQGWTVDQVDQRGGPNGSWTLVFATGLETATLPWGA